MIDSKYSNSRLQKWITQFVQRWLVGHIHPNTLTLIGLLLGIIGAGCIAMTWIFEWSSGFQTWLEQLWNIIWTQGDSDLLSYIRQQGGIWGWRWQIGDTCLLLGGLSMVFSFSADLFDGTVARLTEPTKFGGIFDIFADRLVELLFLLSLIGTNPSQLLWPGVVSFAAIVMCITIFLLLGGAMTPEDLNELDNQQKMIYYATGLMERFETFLFIFLMLCFSPLRVYLLWVFGLLVWFTAFQRFRDAYRLFH